MLVALLAIGAGSGYAASAQSRDASPGSGVATPVPAQRPEMPVEAPRPYAPDPDDPPLLPDLEMRTATLGTGKFEITFPAPVGWRTNANASNEWKWKEPGTSNNSYVMRIEQIDSQDITIEDAIDIRIGRLRDEQEDVEMVMTARNGSALREIRHDLMKASRESRHGTTEDDRPGRSSGGTAPCPSAACGRTS